MYERLKQSYYDNINNQNFVEDYYDVKYNKLMPENIIRERMDEIYNNTFWKDIALEPPYIINNDSFVIEVWHIKKIPFMDIDKYYNIAVNKLKYDNYFWLGEEQINKRKKGCVKTSYEYTDDTLYTICPKCGNKYQENRYFECPNCKSKTKKQKLSGYGVVRCNCGFKYNSRIHEVCPNCNKKR